MVRCTRGPAALSLAALLLAPAAAHAAVASSFDVGLLTVQITTDPETVAVTCSAGDVKVNGADPDDGQLDCSAVEYMQMNGGPGGDTLDLSGVTTTDYTALQYTTIDAETGNDTVTGSAVTDNIFGGIGNDTLLGGGGDDSFSYSSGGGSDEVQGGPGSDGLGVQGAAGGDVVTLMNGADGVLLARTNLAPFTLDVRTIEHITINGQDGDDTVTADDDVAVDLTIDGGTGDDTLTGGAGDDYFPYDNGDGSDVLAGGPGDDSLDALLADESDTVEIRADGAGATIERTNLGPFTLETQGIEKLRVVGVTGPNDFTVELLETIGLELVGGPDAGDSLTVDSGCAVVDDSEAGVFTAEGYEPIYYNAFEEWTVGGGKALVTGDDTFTATGGTGEVELTGGSNCEWTAESSEPWLEITSETSGTGPAVIEFTVAANDGDERTAEITVGGLSATVTQAAGDAGGADAGPDDDDGDGDGDGGGCGCRAGARGGDAALLLLVAAVLVRRRRRR